MHYHIFLFFNVRSKFTLDSTCYYLRYIIKKEREDYRDSTCRKKLRKLGRFGDTSQITLLVVAPASATERRLSSSFVACLFTCLFSSRIYSDSCSTRVERERERERERARSLKDSLSLAPKGVRLDPDAESSLRVSIK